MFTRQTLRVPQWLVEELTPFASGTRSWNVWENWLEMSGSRASRELDAEWFRRITSNPQIEVLRLLRAADIAISPVHPRRVKHDPLDDNEHFAAIMTEADRIAGREAGNAAGALGGCHLIWRIKQRVLKEEFGLDWKSPSELNPGWLFD